MAAPALALDPEKGVDDYIVKRWTEEQDLPHRLVWSVYQARDGYIWLGTQDGLTRFDGMRFTTFNSVTENAFIENSIRCMTETPDGVLWIGPLDSDLLQLRQGRFTRLSAWFVDTWRTTGARYLLVDSKGRLWLTNGGGVGFVDGAGALRSLLAPGVMRRANRRAMAEDGKGRIWYGGPDGLYHVENDRVLPPIKIGSVRGVHADREGTVWLGVDDAGLFRLRNGVVTPVPLPAEMPVASIQINDIHGDRHGNLWIAASNGLCRLRSDGSAATVVPALVATSIQDMIEDASGSLWLATRSGLFQVRDPTFRTYATGADMQDVLSLIEDREGTIWFVSTAAPYVQQVVRGRLRAYPGRVPTGVQCLYQDRSGRYLLGAEDGLYQLRGKRWTLYPGSPASQIRLIYGAPDGQLWLADARDAVYRIRPDGRVSGEARLPGRSIESFLSNRDGTLWIATRDGVFRLKDGKTSEVPLGGTAAQRFARRVMEDADGTIWIGTRTGLTRIKDGRSQAFTVRDGLPDPVVNGIVDDLVGNLWVGCSRGVFRVAKSDFDEYLARQIPGLRCVLFGAGDGIRAGQASGTGGLRSRDGNLWFGTTVGVVMIPRALLRATQAPPAVFIEKATVDDRPVDPTRDAAAPPGDRRTVFNYTALSFDAPEKLRFRYRLDGFDTAWRDAGELREATYTRLRPGDYTFRVIACNGFGVWNATGAALRLCLKPHLYERPSFHALLVALTVTLLWVAYQRRVSAHKARQRELSQKVEERTVDLQREISERIEAEEAVRRLAGALEERVHERTAELEAAKVSLEEDVAIRQRAEQDLSEEKERLAVTLRSIGDGVIATDVSGQIALLNRAAEALTGWTQAEARGRSLAEVFRVVDRWSRDPLPDPIQAVIRAGVVMDLPEQALLLTRDGRERLIADSAAPICDQASRITGAVLVFRDVTEKRRTEEHLANAGKLESIGILTAGIAHDFNNLLTGVFGYIDLARRRSASGEQVSDKLSKALEVLGRARGLAGQLLTFSSGGLPVTAPADMGSLLRNVVRFALAGSNVTADLSIPDDLWRCQIDAGQIGQVIDNLLINARQAMPQGGRVEIRADNVTQAAGSVLAAGRYVRVSIKDRGVGIPVELRNRIFDPFFSTKAGGSGLGLATAHSIVKRHDGHMEFDSVVGVGTTFRVFLPATTAESAPAHASLEEDHPLQGRVLVMDDEEVVRDVLGESLQGLGLRVEAVTDGVAAVESVRSALEAHDPFDLVILDLTIAGGMGGVETLAQLRRLQPSLRAIASSGYSSDPVMADPSKFGFQAMLAKPYAIGDLSRTLRSLLAGSAGREGGASERRDA